MVVEKQKLDSKVKEMKDRVQVRPSETIFFSRQSLVEFPFKSKALFYVIKL